MNVRKIHLNEKLERLGACHFALLLGVLSSNNEVQNFLQYVARILQVKHALLCFNQEPYVWYFAYNKLYAIERENLSTLDCQLEHQLIFDETHEHYKSALHQLQHYGDYYRLIGFNLQLHPNYKQVIDENELTADYPSIGQVFFFDEKQQGFITLQKELALEYCLHFAHYLQLKQNNNELNERFEQQSALNSSKTKFLSVISHDLRAPFHGLLGFSEVLATELDTLDQKSIQDIADYLYDTSKSTYQLLENLLHWSMADGGQFVYHPIKFKVKQVTNIIISILKNLAVQKNIELIEHVPEDLSVYADINMTTSMVQNLVSNALKFTPINGRGFVILSAERVKNQIHISVTDNGLGMSPEQLEHLFQPRVTFSSTGTAGEQGTGFGLALCKRFAHLNQGDISVESQEGIGTCFTVMLPISAD